MVSSIISSDNSASRGAVVPSQSVISDPEINTSAISEWGAIALPKTKLFGTDGIRGRVGDLLTAPFALQLGFWAGQVLQAQGQSSAPVILGQDSRNSSTMLATALSAGFTAAGLDVWNLGLCPTPTVAYLTQALSALGGVMVSASHNPPADNGIKFFGGDGTKLSSDVQAAIEIALRQNFNGKTHPNPSPSVPASGWGRYTERPDLIKTYQDSLQHSLFSQVDFRGMRVVLDLAWGAAAELAPQVFRAMGADVICLHDRPDGDRINVNCGSTHLAPLQQAVQGYGAELGFAFDGDADRVMGVDAQGRVVDGDYILYFWGQALRQANMLPDHTIISTVMANLGFERAWQNSGGTLVRTAVGDQHVHAEMRRRGAMLGGEQSGHILCHHYSVTGDGLLTALHLAALVRKTGRSLSELVDQSFKTYPQVLRNVRVEDRDRRLNWQNCDRLQQAIDEATVAMSEQGRILVRASGTEPVIRVMVEAETEDLTYHWAENLVLAVQRYAAS